MAGMNIENLAMPSEKRWKQLKKQLPGFETAGEAMERDLQRAKLLLQHGTKSAKKLAGKLESEWKKPKSLGSSRHSRSVRMKVTSATCELVETTFARYDGRRVKFDKKGNKVAMIQFVTVMPRKLLLTPKQFKACDPAKLKKSLRDVLNQLGAGKASGWLIMFLDVSFCRTQNRFQLHWHGLAAGGMRKVVRRLLERPSYRPRKKQQKVVQLKNLDRHGYEPGVSYLFKSYPGHRMDFENELTGKISSKKIGTAVKNPWHSQFLLWRHRQQLRDLSLLMKLRVRKTGFTVMR